MRIQQKSEIRFIRKNQCEAELQNTKVSLKILLKGVIFASNQALMSSLHQELKALQSYRQQEDINTLNRLLPEMKQIAQDFLQKDTTYQKIQKEFQEVGDIFANVLEKIPKVLEGKSIYHSQISTSNASVLEKAQIYLEKLDLYQKIFPLKSLNHI